MSKETISLLIAGDLAPTIENENLFIVGDVDKLVGSEIVDLFSQADVSSINLECPLTTFGNPIQKQGPNLKAAPGTINGIRNLNPKVICLANNHIMDFGEPGLQDTLKLLDEFHLDYVGIGKDLNEAATSVQIIEKKGWKLGFYACAEHEFSIATTNSSGAAPFDPLLTGNIIRKLKKENSLDRLIIFFHGGKEYYQYPSPGLQKICRYFVKEGADLVVCQHSHCIGALEHYLDGDIIYGQGNFLFETKNPLSIDSILISCTFSNSDTSQFEFIPIKRRVDGSGTIYQAKGEEKENILKEFFKRSKQLMQPGQIEANYLDFAKQLLPNYLYGISPFGKWFSRIDRYIFKGKIIKFIYPKKKLLLIQNIIECEAHRELVAKSLNECGKE